MLNFGFISQILNNSTYREEISDLSQPGNPITRGLVAVVLLAYIGARAYADIQGKKQWLAAEEQERLKAKQIADQNQQIVTKLGVALENFNEDRRKKERKKEEKKEGKKAQKEEPSGSSDNDESFFSNLFETSEIASSDKLPLTPAYQALRSITIDNPSDDLTRATRRPRNK